MLFFSIFLSFLFFATIYLLKSDNYNLQARY